MYFENQRQDEGEGQRRRCEQTVTYRRVCDMRGNAREEREMVGV